MLNTEKAKRFQCFGFAVGVNNPIQIVPDHAQEFPLRRALQDRVLLDVTGQDIKDKGSKIVADIDKAIKAQLFSPVTEGEEVGPKVICGTDAKGNTYFVTPKDENDYNRMMLEIQTTGTLRIEKPKNNAPTITGLTSIYEEEVPFPTPED